MSYIYSSKDIVMLDVFYLKACIIMLIFLIKEILIMDAVNNARPFLI